MFLRMILDKLSIHLDIKGFEKIVDTIKEVEDASQLVNLPGNPKN